MISPGGMRVAFAAANSIVVIATVGVLTLKSKLNNKKVDNLKEPKRVYKVAKCANRVKYYQNKYKDNKEINKGVR